MQIIVIMYLAVIVLTIAGMWKTFDKAGQPGWAAIVPFYNMYVLTQVAGKEVIWFVLMLVPFINVIAYIVVSIGVAETFGKGAGFGIGLWLLPFIFYPILGFGGERVAGGPERGAGPPPPPGGQSPPPPPTAQG